MIPGRELRSHMCCVCLVIQSCLTLCDPMDCSPPGSSVHGDSPGKNTGAGSKPSSRRSSQPRDRTQVSHKAGGFFTKVPHAKEQLSPARNCGVHTPQLETPRFTTKVPRDTTKMLHAGNKTRCSSTNQSIN